MCHPCVPVLRQCAWGQSFTSCLLLCVQPGAAFAGVAAGKSSGVSTALVGVALVSAALQGYLIGVGDLGRGALASVVRLLTHLADRLAGRRASV